MAATVIVLKGDLLHVYCILIVLPENPPKDQFHFYFLSFKPKRIKDIVPDVKFSYSLLYTEIFSI